MFILSVTRRAVDTVLTQRTFMDTVTFALCLPYQTSSSLVSYDLYLTGIFMYMYNNRECMSDIIITSVSVK